MANLKEVRTRIESVNSTMQITSAMKMVSASKLRKFQNAITALRPYADNLNKLMHDVSSDMDTSAKSVFAEMRQSGKILVIPVTSNKGLCGVFNAIVIKETEKLIKEDFKQQLEEGNVDVLCIGSKADEMMKARKYHVIGNESNLLDNLTYDNVVPFAERLMNDFKERKYDRIIFVYNQFKNAGTQILVHEQFLPIAVENENDDEKEMKTEEVDYIFQPNREDILNELIPKSLKLQVYKIILDSFTSEQGARMVSMTKATDNAMELLKELNITYNKTRQSSITNEIVEIVSGANALNG
ncbi:MAG TPA: ATP synthase F1 subunit gamma [Bacteroidetes bacterium]|nr:ATP synthase F1 subunit gamma [Candidatus Limimorpha avicola]